MIIPVVLLAALTSLGTVYYILSTLALVSHFRWHRATFSEPATGRVSVLKPVCGIDAGARPNFESFLRQDYPSYEVLFGVLDEDDPAIPLIREVIKDSTLASLHIGSEITGANNKVRILDNLARHADGDIFCITDADTRVEPDSLRRVVGLFEDESVGVVSCMYRGVASENIADRIEALYMTTIFEPGVACAYYLGQEFGLGAMIAIRRSALEETGGFESIVDYLADDFQLAHRAVQAGYRLGLADYVVDIALPGAGLRDMLGRQLRWCQTQKTCNPPGYLGFGITHGFTYAVLLWLISGFSSWALLVLAVTGAIRLGTAYTGSRICLGDRVAGGSIYLLPVCDLLSFCAWAAAPFTRTTVWRGRRLSLRKDGKISTTE